MNWHDVWILYQRELRSALRERAIVINSLLIPVFLYPVMLWMMFSGVTFVEGLADGFHSRVVVQGLPPAHAPLLDSLRAAGNVEVRTRPDDDAEELLEQVRTGELDALVVFLPPEPGAAALADNFSVQIHFDRSVERSRRARERVEGAIDRYRSAWLEREAAGLGLSRGQLEGFRVDRRSIATGRQMGALVLSEMIPLFLVIMVAFGCFYPAIDATAGERERSTWETLMTVSASRMSIVTAKYLYVATLGTLAGILNVLAMMMAVGGVLGPFFARGGDASLDFAIPPLAVPLMLAGALVLGLFFAATMMILAAFARTFREGQAMITPLTWILFFPLLLGNSPDRRLTAFTALMPLANVTQMIKDALRGVFQWGLIFQTFAVQLVLIAGCLYLARFVLRFEDFLLGAYGGSLWKFFRERVLRGGRSPAPQGSGS